ncbi:ABC transporter ATP-binding protein [Salibacterium halotolerans]|uniref:Energy-coupling factor transport system ATP-binding protein n=1 Tax=Salibacterium halotolerans TaxID=1884432 RepID=A0A1I5V6Q6_9BACI|nr:ATP-binding cassette domain-containing protein [Salibacterium halotolerans]SFQ03037.1 energy-coupling factor transport system ATP-binding protein [Salibacterium halotolerans]
MKPSPIIELEHVNFSYPSSVKRVLQDVSLTVNRGDFLAVIGGNGSGKTTLCKTFNGLIPHYYNGALEGAVRINGEATEDTNTALLSKTVGYVYQDFESQLVRPRVLDEVRFAPLNYGWPDYKERGDEALDMLGLNPIKNEFIWQLSGGQKHLTALASVLSLQPEVIIVDEPVAQLDPVHARDIYHTLQYLNREHGITIIVIEHHTEFIAEFAQSAVLMDAGTVKWKKPVADAMRSIKDLQHHNILPPPVTRLAEAAGAEESDVPITLEEGANWFSSRVPAASPRHIAPVPPGASEKTKIASFDRVTQGYKTVQKTFKWVFEELSLSFYEGERIALVGGNGAGKSSLLKMLTGILRPRKGNITAAGQPVARTSPEKIAEQVTYIYQNPEEMFIADNIRADIEYFLKARKSPEAAAYADELCRLFSLEDLQDKDGRLLSGGQQRRASLAIGLGTQPSLLLLDEPTSSLDINSREEVARLLHELKEHVKTVVIATHDMDLVAEWASRVIVLNEGTVEYDGGPRGLFSRHELMRRCSLHPPQIVRLSEKLGIQPSALDIQEFLPFVKGGGPRYEPYPAVAFENQR